MISCCHGVHQQNSPSFSLWMMFLQRRSLWESTTGEPSCDRCSFIHIISCSRTSWLGTSCWILIQRRHKQMSDSSSWQIESQEFLTNATTFIYYWVSIIKSCNDMLLSVDYMGLCDILTLRFNWWHWFCGPNISYLTAWIMCGYWTLCS